VEAAVFMTTGPLVVSPEEDRVLIQAEGSIRRSHTSN
jgi:hypothetical protein